MAAAYWSHNFVDYVQCDACQNFSEINALHISRLPVSIEHSVMHACIQ